MKTESKHTYPIARRHEAVEDFHGTLVPDPYRWLQDADDEETRAWVGAQNELTKRFLAGSQSWETLKERLLALWNFPKATAPYRKGQRYFFSRNDGLQDQFVLYRQDGLASEPVVVLDPNQFSEDGTVALTNQAVSHDGKLLAYGISVSGSDWQEIRVSAVDSGEEYADVIRWCKFAGIAWKHDGLGFFYNRFPEPGTVPFEDQTNFNSVYWHRLGTDQATDPLVYQRPDAKELAFNPLITDDGRYLLLHVWHGTDPKNRVYYRSADDDGEFVRLLDQADARYDFIDNVGPVFYFLTDLDAPRGRIIAVDVHKPGRDQWHEVLPEGEDAIAFAIMAANRLAVATLHHACHQLKVYDLDGGFVMEIQLPDLGTISGLSGRREDDELFVAFESFLYPPSVFRFDFGSQELALLHQPVVDFPLEDYETRQVFYRSRDGTRVPMFLVHRRGLMLDGSHPVMLFGYGGFSVSMTPFFGVSNLVWLEHGGVFALPNLRGGGEYGEAWHQAGTLANKQNVFDDFIAAGQWLIDSGYTDSSKLAIMGGSNGGLLVAACMVQRPDLFGAVVCRVPVIDMLHYHQWTIGRYWVTDYGNAEADSEHFQFLYAYSPLHNVRDGETYPPTLIMTADTDDRVVPAHAKKFAARLQAADRGVNPILLRVETKAGHGLGKPTSKIVEEQADLYAFLFEVLGIGRDSKGAAR